MVRLRANAFEVSEGFHSKLRHVAALDNRSDEEILESLDQYQPVVTEKNVWAFWHAGLRSMPSWCRRNVISWARLNGKDWTIRVLDHVDGSPNNVLHYLPEDMVPPVFVKREMAGPFVGQHSADLIRGACLFVHGGIWLDVGNILFGRLDRICWDFLEDPSTPFEMSVMHMGGGSGTGISNHLIAARKNSPFIKRWHDLFAYLWKDRTNCTGISKNPLLAPVLHGSATFHGDEETDRWGWEHVYSPEAIQDYGAQILAWQRIIMLDDLETGFSGVEYYTQKILLLDVLDESWRAEVIVGWRGHQLFDSIKARWKAVMTLLADSSLQKIYRGKEMMKYPALGTLWDEEENEDKDHEPGTFAELLRYGSVHFEQTRGILYVENPRPSLVLKRGLLEV
ncbi:glycosyltransferase [Aspergillus stella-maris]|uniref:glycosyltransferase n=1 Tax=Aspergillus stella-maris TaxID=1810926 RepID=UPI003CCCED2E